MSGTLSLTRSEVGGVLKYWLAALRYEEALATRPRARRIPADAAPRVDVDDPDDAQTYFKIPPDEAAVEFLWGRAKALSLPLDAERAAVCERWLAQAYLRERLKARGREPIEDEAWFVGFPVVHFARSGELATLLRAPVELSWHTADGSRFLPRQSRGRSAPPTEVQLVLGEEEDSLVPYALDRQLLTTTLGVDDEEVEDVLAAFGEAPPSPAEMVDAVVGLLTGDAVDGVDFSSLLAAVRAQLPPGAQVYPVALLYDGRRIHATWHLQRELGMLLRKRPGDAPWDGRSALWAYLSGERVAPGRGRLVCGYHPEPPTDDQRAVGELLAGSALTAAQGPPGTGKTRLILELAADAVVRRALGVVEQEVMGRAQLLVCSTNNRAVDNALDPLTVQALPLGLRLGNREVTATRTVELLERAAAWVDATLELGALEAYDAAKARFAEAWTAHEEVVAPARDARLGASGRAALEAELARLGAAPAPDAEEYAAVAAADRALSPVRHDMGRLLRIASRGGGGALGRLSQLWPKAEKRIAQLAAALEPLALSLELALPPELSGDADDRLATWEDALEDADAEVEALRLAVEERRSRWADGERRVELEAKLTELARGPAPPEPPDPARVAELERAVFEAALELRATWAAVHRAPLRDALQRGIEAASGRRGLRGLFEDDLDSADWLRRLFPVLGCTLLSLGNALPAEAEWVERVVLDEAGQCHPAYAVSAMLRCERALVVGDTNQLRPVLRLEEGDDARVLATSGAQADPARLLPYRLGPREVGSAQTLADRAVMERPTLHDHFRCHPTIIELSDALCDYGLRVRTPVTPPRGGPLYAPLLHAPVAGQQIRSGGSWANPAEIEALLDILRGSLAAGVGAGEIAVLTPYVGQLDRLRRALREARLPLESEADDHLARGITTGTVHRFQGGERPIVLFTTVVTRPRSLGFLNERVNLVNVAVSRAREHLVVVGDTATLEAGRCTSLLVRRASKLVPVR